MLLILDSNIESKSTNNTYLNFIKIFYKLFKKNKHHGTAKFGCNFDFGKRFILSFIYFVEYFDDFGSMLL